jgi:DNA-binding HxlR family transcriptional regulator
MTQDRPGVRQCRIADALDVVGERWALLIIRELLWGNHRFGAIAERTGAPRDILSARLKRLTEAGLIETRQYNAHPPRNEYHLTERGRALQPVLLTLEEWSSANLVRDPALPDAVRAPHHDHQLHPVSSFTCQVCGEAIPLPYERESAAHEH